MTEKSYLETLKKCPGSLYFLLLKFAYRAIENQFATKMYALLVNFIFSRFRAYVNIVVSASVIQLKNL